MQPREVSSEVLLGSASEPTAALASCLGFVEATLASSPFNIP